MKRLLPLPIFLLFFAQAHSNGVSFFRHNPVCFLQAKDTGRLSPDEDEEEEVHERVGGREKNKDGRRAQTFEPSVYLLSPAETMRRSSVIEQTWFGSRPAPQLQASFEGLGEGFSGPQGTAFYR